VLKCQIKPPLLKKFCKKVSHKFQTEINDLILGTIEFFRLSRNQRELEVNERAKKSKLNISVFVVKRGLTCEKFLIKSFEFCKDVFWDSKNKKLSLNLNDIANTGRMFLLNSQLYIDAFLLNKTNLKISFQLTLL